MPGLQRPGLRMRFAALVLATGSLMLTADCRKSSQAPATATDAATATRAPEATVAADAVDRKSVV